jgi:hypothetical protein
MVLKRQMLAIQDVDVPVKRRQTLEPKKVEALAESIWQRVRKRPFSCGRTANSSCWLRGCIVSKLAAHSARPPFLFIWFRPVGIDPCPVRKWRESRGDAEVMPRGYSDL